MNASRLFVCEAEGGQGEAVSKLLPDDLGERRVWYSSVADKSPSRDIFAPSGRGV